MERYKRTRHAHLTRYEVPELVFGLTVCVGCTVIEPPELWPDVPLLAPLADVEDEDVVTPTLDACVSGVWLVKPQAVKKRQAAAATRPSRKR